MDRKGADFEAVVSQIRKRLNLNPVITQVPIGQEEQYKGLIDLVSMKRYSFEGDQGQNVIVSDIDNINDVTLHLVDK